MDLYSISYSIHKDMAWASGYGPVGDLWFLNPKFLESKLAFWKVNPTPPGISIDSRGKIWPDVLGCGGSPPPFFVSERLIGSLLDQGAKFGRISEIPIAEIKSKFLKAIEHPKYFIVETLPGIEVDFEASNIPIDSQGSPILNPLPKPWPPLLRLRAVSWNGLDLFGYKNYAANPSITWLCTEKIRGLAERENWKNIQFNPLHVI